MNATHNMMTILFNRPDTADMRGRLFFGLWRFV
jgi:hypothetical protein